MNHMYPCTDCIVKLQCVDPCIRLELDEEIIFKLLKHYKKCPDCGCNMFNKFETGSLTVTIKCLGCLREFVSGASVDLDPIKFGNKDARIAIKLGRLKQHTYKVNAKEYYGTEIVDEIIERFKDL